MSPGHLPVAAAAENQRQTAELGGNKGSLLSSQTHDPQDTFCPCLLILGPSGDQSPASPQPALTSRCELSIRTPKVPNWEHWQCTWVVFRYTSSQSLAVQKPEGLVLQPPKKQSALRREGRRVWCVRKEPQTRGMAGNGFLPADTTALLQPQYWSQSPAGTLWCPSSRSKSLGGGRNPHVPVLPSHTACHGQGTLGTTRCQGKAALPCLTHGLEWFHWTQRGLLLLAVSSR